MGVVGKGNVTHSKVGNYSGKVSKILSKGSSIPFIGKICQLISTVAGLYIN